MRIALFGSSLVSSYWNGAATYYRGIVRALDARGHRVVFFEPDAYDRQSHRDLGEVEWADVVVYDPAEWEAALESARGADVVVKASGVGVCDRELEEGVLELDAALTVFWDVDAPATLAGLEEDAADPLRELVPRYDFVLTYGGGDPVVERYLALGAQRCVPIYNALDPVTHHPVAPVERWRSDLSLLANRLPDREQRIDEFFLAAAKLAPARAFLLGGAGWDDKAVPRNVRVAGHVPTAAHNAFNSSALAVLNVSRLSMVENGFSPATRIFEAAGAGACIVTDAWDGVELFLEPGTEILVAADGAEVAALIGELTPAHAGEIGDRARRRVLAEHTYVRRAGQVEELLETVLA